MSTSAFEKLLQAAAEQEMSAIVTEKKSDESEIFNHKTVDTLIWRIMHCGVRCAFWLSLAALFAIILSDVIFSSEPAKKSLALAETDPSRWEWWMFLKVDTTIAWKYLHTVAAFSTGIFASRFRQVELNRPQNQED